MAEWKTLFDEKRREYLFLHPDGHIAKLRDVTFEDDYALIAVSDEHGEEFTVQLQQNSDGQWVVQGERELTT